MATYSLPSELTTKILNFLDKNSLSCVLQVSKSWRKHALPIYYSSFEIKEDDINLEQVSEYGEFAKELNIVTSRGASERGHLKKPVLLSLIAAFPKLKKLVLTRTSYDYIYLEMLCDITTDNNFLNLEEIKCNSSDSYIITCHFYCNSIRKLKIEENHLIPFGPGAIGHYLAHFSFLVDLTIVNRRLPDWTLFDILHSCENLSKLEYQSDFPVPLNAKNQVGTVTNIYLKELKVDLPLDATPYIDCIKSLSTLESLTLVIKGDIYEWYQNIGVFVEHLRRFKNLSIRQCTSVYYVPPSKLKMHAFYNFLLKLKGDTNLKYRAIISFCATSTVPAINIHNGVMNFEYQTEEDHPLLFTDKQGIIKSLIFQTRYKFQVPSEILDYAQTCRGIERLTIKCGYLHLKVNPTTMTMHNFFYLCQPIWDQLYSRFPNVEIIDCRKTVNLETNLLENTSLDFTAFKNLKTFIFDINQLKIRDYVYVNVNNGDKHFKFRVSYKKCGNRSPGIIDSSAVSFKFLGHLKYKFKIPSNLEMVLLESS